MTQRGPRATRIDFPDCGHAPALNVAPQIDAIMEGRDPPPPAGWNKSNKDGGNDTGGDARPLPPIAGPADSH
ncbi:hypothetical protein G6F46_015832 [Rhizopus delemar]|nr:hypothetical protein G6F46_015832 [Rhizopus delemar]